MSNHFNNPRLNTDSLIKLIPIFMMEIRDDFAKSEEAFLSEDYQLYLDFLHKMKGSALSFGITELVDMTDQLKGIIHEKNYRRGLVEHEKLRRLITDLNEELKKMA